MFSTQDGQKMIFSVILLKKLFRGGSANLSKSITHKLVKTSKNGPD